MKKYIEREAIINAIKSTYVEQPRIERNMWCQGWHDACNRIWSRMEEQSAADVRENVRGEWLSKEYMDGDLSVGIADEWIDRLAEQSDCFAYCSVCGKSAGYNAEQSLILSDFCPGCGADMRKGAQHA